MQHAALLKNILQWQCSVESQSKCKVMCPQVVSIRVQDQVWGGGWRGLGAGHRTGALTIQSSKSVPWVSVTQLYYKCFQNYFSIT